MTMIDMNQVMSHDMNASDVTCINSTLSISCEYAQHYGVTPVITFDQPLW